MKEVQGKRRIAQAVLTAALALLLVAGAFVLAARTGSKDMALPVLTAAVTEAPDALTVYKQERAQTRREDRAALEKLLARTDLDEQNRTEAEAMLARLIRFTEEELALEGALAASGIAPCACVRAEGAVTVVTARAMLSEGERTLLLTLCQTHTGVEPAGVQVVTAP